MAQLPPKENLEALRAALDLAPPRHVAASWKQAAACGRRIAAANRRG